MSNDVPSDLRGLVERYENLRRYCLAWVGLESDDKSTCYEALCFARHGHLPSANNFASLVDDMASALIDKQVPTVWQIHSADGIRYTERQEIGEGWVKRGFKVVALAPLPPPPVTKEQPK